MFEGWRERALVLTAVACAAAPTSAQDTWLVLPVAIGEEPATDVRHFAEVSAAGIETQHATTLQGPVLEHRLANAISLPYDAAPADELARELASSEHNLLRQLARGRYDEVIARALGFLDRGRESLSLQRSPEASTHLGLVCAYRAAAELEQGERDQAALHARECLGLVPGFVPDERFTPQVHELFQREQAGLSTLHVQGSRDDPPGCVVRINGRSVGQTPSVRVRVPPGEYRVQVECNDAPGRVHQAHVDGAGETALLVRGTLDAALRTDPPGLVYASSSALEWLPGDLAHAARLVGATHAYAIVQQTSSALLRSYAVPQDGPATLLGERTVGRTSDPSHVRESATQLARSGRALAAPASSNNSESISPVGPVVLAIGGATLIAGAVVGALFIAENDALVSRCPEARCAPELRDNAESVHRLALATDVLLWGGGAVAVTGLILTLALRTNAEEMPLAVGCDPNGCTASASMRF